MTTLTLTDDDFLAAERELCRRSMAQFTRRAWRQIIPDKLIWGWHLDAVSEHLEAVANGQINRLLINVPPGTSKSTMTGVIFPSWLWGPGEQPGHRYIGAAHEQGLAVRDNRMMRALVTSNWYQRLWPLRMTGDQNEKLYFENESRGFRQACAVASMTGRRGHTIVWDDPLSPQKANSQAHREEAIRILTETVPTRLNDPETSSIIIVMQRLHEYDPAGFILSEGLGYEHLCLPMEFEPDRKCSTSIGWTDPRKEEGELLDPVRFPPHVIERDKKAMGPYAWAGQMQQRPAPRDGGMFPVDRFQIIDHMPPADQIAASIRYWDKAGTAGGGAFSAGVLMHRLRDGRFCVSDVSRGQWSILDRESRIKQTAQIDGKGVEIRIEQEPGSGGKESAEATIRNLAGFTVKADRPTGDKELRAQPYAAQVQGGNVLLVRGAWNRPFMDEHEMFPNGKFKDQVDAAGGAFSALAKPKSDFRWSMDGQSYED